MSLNLVIATATPTGQPLTTPGGVALATHTATETRLVQAQVQLGDLGGSVAATVQVWTVIKDASANVLTPRHDYEVRTKAAAQTRMLFRQLGPIWLAAGQTIEVWASATASATAASAVVTLLDLATPQPLTGATLDADYDAAKTAAQAGDQMGLTEGAIEAVRDEIEREDGMLDRMDAGLYGPFTVDGEFLVDRRGAKFRWTDNGLEVIQPNE